MSLGTEVGLGPGHIVLDGDPAPKWKGAQQLPLCCGTVAHLSNCYGLVMREFRIDCGLAMMNCVNVRFSYGCSELLADGRCSS